MTDIREVSNGESSPVESTPVSTSSLLGMLLTVNSMLPESQQTQNKDMLEVYAAMSSFMLSRTGGIHPDLQESTEQKAMEVLQNHQPLFNLLLSSQPQPPTTTYEPGMAPVYRLPVELLARIFMIVVEVRRPELRPYAPPPTPLTKVCRRWRAVVDQTPQLWRAIILSRGLAQTKLWLQRSQGISLDVHLTTSVLKNPPNHDQSARLVLEELPRIRTLFLRLDVDRDRLLAETPALLRLKPAPALEMLEYYGADYRVEFEDDLDDKLFTGECPDQLRVVTVTDATVHPECPIFYSQLTTLSLSRCAVWETVDDMMRTLAGLPSLEHFTWTMHDEVPLTILDQAPVETLPRSVRLPNLKSLELQEEILIPLSIFTCLDIPPTVSIAIDGLLESVLWRDLMDNALARLDETLGAYFSAVLGEDGFTTLTLMEFAGDNESGYSAVFEEPSLSSSPQKFTLGFCYLSDHVEEYNALLSRTLSWDPCRRAIRRVLMRHDLEFLSQEVSWATLLQPLTLVEEIHTRSGAGIALLAALSDTTHPDRAPALRKVVLHNAQGFAEVNLDQLLQSLDARAAAGHPKLSLSFLACDIAEDQVVALEESTCTDEIFCHPRVDKEMLAMAERLGLTLPPSLTGVVGV